MPTPSSYKSRAGWIARPAGCNKSDHEVWGSKSPGSRKATSRIVPRCTQNRSCLRLRSRSHVARGPQSSPRSILLPGQRFVPGRSRHRDSLLDIARAGPSSDTVAGYLSPDLPRTKTQNHAKRLNRLNNRNRFGSRGKTLTSSLPDQSSPLWSAKTPCDTFSARYIPDHTGGRGGNRWDS